MLAASSVAYWLLVNHKPAIQTKAVAHVLPQVDVALARPQSLRLDVASQGVVQARSQIELVAEVPGKIAGLHPGFAAGGFFEAGDTLIEIDSRDYRLAVTKAQATVAEARKELVREQAEAQQALQEWQSLGSGQASDYALHKPHLAERQAKLAAAEAGLAEAQLKLSRCRLPAPFSGRVLSKRVDTGQFVAAQTVLAAIYATDAFDVRLPVPASELAFLPLPWSAEQTGTYPQVTLTAQLGDRIESWHGRIIRNEGVVEESTGMLHVVAEIKQPYKQAGSPPLPLGLFVHADIAGVERPGLVELPKTALRAGYQVYVVDNQQRLRLRTVEVLRSLADSVIVKGGIAPGEQVLLAGVDLPVEGMQVAVKSSAKLAEAKP